MEIHQEETPLNEQAYTNEKDDPLVNTTSDGKFPRKNHRRKNFVSKFIGLLEPKSLHHPKHISMKNYRRCRR